VSDTAGTLPATPWKILVVEDEPDLELLITQRFRRQIRGGEFAFQFAGAGKQALRLLAADPEIGLVLAGINMPAMDGFTLLAEPQCAADAPEVSLDLADKPCRPSTSASRLWRLRRLPRRLFALPRRRGGHLL
jgi:CheY-like chemotaxis protein